jgi:ABC-type phosphonate transport system ATPase subunit
MDVKAEPYPLDTTRRRLIEGAACLERLDAERERRGDSHFGKTTEDRVVWGQLIELELQEIDEQLSRLHL